MDSGIIELFRLLKAQGVQVAGWKLSSFEAANLFENHRTPEHQPQSTMNTTRSLRLSVQ